ncbi:CAP domain-containing protein [Algibacter sp. L1A34]|uniref:CAP domain-containing protein n=1 Tax=Algibacter sp. L1A34 TaxID=2686365 RepID=UPI00131AE535|nr:CAP domain-containing protein [Algibacter sp. L1A34]
MKKLLLITAVLLSAFLTSCSVEEDVTAPEEYNSETINVTYTQMDYDIAELINEHRTSQGLVELNILNKASKEAISHNTYMVKQGTPSHDFFYVRSENLKKEAKAIVVSENVGYGFSTAKTLVKAWLESEEHRKNLENPNFTDMGISSKKDENGRNYFTNIFVKR